MTSYSSNGVGIGFIAISNNLQNVSGVSGTTLQVSNNSGSSWTQRVSTGSNGLAGIGMSDDGVYQTTPVNNGPYYRSTNSGVSFSSNGSNLYHHAVSVSYNGQYQTMSRYPNTVRVSSNYGASFSDQNFGSVTGWSQGFCSGNGQYQMASMDAGHIFISSNYGSTWTQGTTSSAGWQRLGMSGDGKYCSGHSSDGNCWKSSNYGSSGSWSVAFTGASGPILFSSTGQYQVVNLGGALYYSLDYGVTWPQILPSVGYGAYAITSNGSVAASSGTSVYVFTHP
jgi:hypothetical protein